MAANYDSQYRPIYTSETATDAPLGVRQVRDMANNVNNMFGRVVAPVLVCDMFPGFHCSANSQTEAVLLRWAPRFCATGWTKLIFSICASSVTHNCVFKLYASQNRYISADTLSVYGVASLGNYDVGSLTIDAASDIPVPVALDLFPNPADNIYLMLTATMAGESIGYLHSITVVASHEGII